MNRRSFLGALVALPIVAKLPLPVPAPVPVFPRIRLGEVLTVGRGGEYATIQAALNVAGRGCIVLLAAGHSETIAVTAPLRGGPGVSVVGAGRYRPTLTYAP